MIYFIMIINSKQLYGEINYWPTWDTFASWDRIFFYFFELQPQGPLFFIILHTVQTKCLADVIYYARTAYVKTFYLEFPMIVLYTVLYCMTDSIYQFSCIKLTLWQKLENIGYHILLLQEFMKTKFVIFG